MQHAIFDVLHEWLKDTSEASYSRSPAASLPGGDDNARFAEHIALVFYEKVQSSLRDLGLSCTHIGLKMLVYGSNYSGKEGAPLDS